jgi:hypothetical protein
MTGDNLPRRCALAAGACVAPRRPPGGDLPGVSWSEPPGIPGFAVSRFGPLVSAVVQRCVGAPDAPGNLVASRGEHTAIVLGSVFGDSVTLDTGGEQFARYGRPAPLLSHQAVPTSVFGMIASSYGITGPVCCVSAFGEMASTLLALADDLLDDGDVHQVLVIAVELEGTQRVQRVRRHLAASGVRLDLPAQDTAVSLLVRRATHGPAADVAAGADAETGERLEGFGLLRPLVRLCVALGEAAPSEPRRSCRPSGRAAG